jgi:hypothetical protein
MFERSAPPSRHRTETVCTYSSRRVWPWRRSVSMLCALLESVNPVRMHFCSPMLPGCSRAATLPVCTCGVCIDGTPFPSPRVQYPAHRCWPPAHIPVDSWSMPAGTMAINIISIVSLTPSARRHVSRPAHASARQTLNGRRRCGRPLRIGRNEQVAVACPRAVAFQQNHDSPCNCSLLMPWSVAPSSRRFLVGAETVQPERRAYSLAESDAAWNPIQHELHCG